MACLQKSIQQKSILQKNIQTSLFSNKLNFFSSHSKGLIILPTAVGVLADFWVPNEIDSLNFPHILFF